MKSCTARLAALWVLALSAWSAPAQATVSVYEPAAGCELSALRDDPDALLACFAPVFVAEGTESTHNRIGRPELAPALLRDWTVRVDPDRPELYTELRRDRIGERDVLQLVYRIHFERIPFRWTHSFYEAHRNAGLLALITIDAETLAPLFVTTVHTCGCYRAIIPTQHVDAATLPAGHADGALEVYGERLPATLPAPFPGGARVTIWLRAHNHRVHDVTVGDATPRDAAVPLPLRPMHALRALPVPGDADGKTVSMFYERGPLAGHVRGAWNPLEGLTLFGLVALDPTVGMDKDFGDPAVTGTPFYTSLRFWRHEASRLDRFDSLLREVGYAL